MVAIVPQREVEMGNGNVELEMSLAFMSTVLLWGAETLEGILLEELKYGFRLNLEF